MGYFVQLKASAEWLATHQNSDGGWGLSPGQGSSIVNTAESIYILGECGRAEGISYLNCIIKGFDYIWSKLESDLEKVPLTRYVQFALWNVKHCHWDVENQVNRYTNWLINAQNADGGWGYKFSDSASMLFSTILSVLVLTSLPAKINQEPVRRAKIWLLEKRNGSGTWGINSNDGDYVGTSQAVLALAHCRYQFSGAERESLLKYIRANDDWGTHIENLPGTKWEHSKSMWVVLGMLSLGAEPYCAEIASAVRDANSRIFDHGWKEPDGAITIRGQFWVATMFSEIHKAYDPGIITYRIDSFLSIAKPAYQEPDFVHIFPGNRIFKFVFHSSVYRTLSYLSLIASFAILLLVPAGDFMIARANIIAFVSIFSVCLFLLSFWLMKKRKALFPKWIGRSVFFIMLGTFFCFQVLNAAIGISIKDFFPSEKEILGNIKIKNIK